MGPAAGPDLGAVVAADRAALTDAIAERHTTLAQLAESRASDMLAYQAARREMVAARRVAIHAAQSVNSANLSMLSAQVQNLLLALTNDRVALVKHAQTDFTGIRAARVKLAADLHALRLSKIHRRK